MYIISTSMGNDSIALLQWAHEQGLEDCYVVYADTGWSHPSWGKRLSAGIKLAERYGFVTWIVKGQWTFETLAIMKKGFPSQKNQWCSGILKGIPLTEFADFIDPYHDAITVIGKRRAESQARKDIPEFDNDSPFHTRTVWHPLYKHSDKQRNALVARAGFEVLPHRSMECCPCVNANRSDLCRTPEVQIGRVRVLEGITGQPMFRAKKHMGAKGIDEVLKWATSDTGKYREGQGLLWNHRGEFCHSGLCG